jgi:hypothetical protein
MALVAISIRRQARMRQMVAVALALLALAVLFVSLVTATGGWKLTDRRPRRLAPTYRQTVDRAIISSPHVRNPPASAVEMAVVGSIAAAVEHSALLVF